AKKRHQRWSLGKNRERRPEEKKRERRLSAPVFLLATLHPARPARLGCTRPTYARKSETLQRNALCSGKRARAPKSREMGRAAILPCPYLLKGELYGNCQALVYWPLGKFSPRGCGGIRVWPD